MASGPLPAGGASTGLKLFVYAVGRMIPATTTPGDSPEVNFLAQVVQLNETGEVTVTIKTDSSSLPASEAAKQLVALMVHALAAFQPQ